MLATIVFCFTIVVYLFSFINFFWLKIKVSPRVLNILKVTHFGVLAIVLFPLLASYFSTDSPTYYYSGKYTRFVVFWGFLISGFLLASLGLVQIKNKLVKFYLFLLQYIWVLIIVISFIVPLLGLITYYLLESYAKLPKKTVYENTSFRIDEWGTGKIMTPEHLKIYSLFQKRGIFETESSIHLYSEVKGMPTVTVANVMQLSADTVLVTMTFNEDILLDGDSVSKTISQKVKLN